MRKVLLGSMVLLMALLSGCSSTATDLEKAIKNVKNSQNFTIDLQITNDTFGILQQGTSYIDGDEMTIILSDLTKHYYFEDESLYYLYEEDGYMVSSLAFPSELSDLDKINDNNFYDEFDLDSFTEVTTGLYTTDLSYFGLTDVQVKVDEYIEEIKGEYVSASTTNYVIITFSDYKETTVNIPDYTEKTEKEIMCDYTERYSYACVGGATDDLHNYGFGNILVNVEYIEESSKFIITNSFTEKSFEYYPEFNRVTIDDKEMTVLDYKNAYSSTELYIGETIFVILEDLYTIK